MALSDFGIDPDRYSTGVQRALFRATEEARRRQHSTITIEHVLYGLAITEWPTFQILLRGIHLDANDMLAAIEQSLDHFPQGPVGEPVPDNTSGNVMITASHICRRAQRTTIEPADMFVVMFHDCAHLLAYLFVEPALIHALDAFTQRWVNSQEHDSVVTAHFQLPVPLRAYAVNCNLLAHMGKIHPVVGRDDRLREVMEILCHKDRPNSLMVTGEPGVGKTALVETLAWKIEHEPLTVPVRLRACQILNLNMNAMVAGTTLRGMFEERLQNVIAEIQKSPHYILFVDEAHTLVGAGSALGTVADASNIIKSVLARGEIRMIGATTLDEYKAFIQDDEAFARRFRVVHLQEPTIEETRMILKHVVPRLEKNYNVTIADDAVETVLELAPRYQRNLHLPDKVIGWLDTAAVRTEIDQTVVVDRARILMVVSDSAEIPHEMMSKDDQTRFQTMADRLSSRVVGQIEAVRAVAEQIVMNKGPLKQNPNRPDGVLLFLGPTGVGKTELAKACAAFLFGDEKKMIRIDMSEYQEGHASVDKLIGQPRGIVGSERGGLLTNQLRDHPCTVVLLDEIEKAHPNVLNVFLQAFDEGWLTDGRGRRVYLSDAIVIMTSNLGAEHFKSLTNPFGFAQAATTLQHMHANIAKAYEQRLSPEFRNRIDRVVVFQPLTPADVLAITQMYVNDLIDTFVSKHRTLIIDDAVIDHLAVKGFSLAYGARFLKRTIDEHLRIPLSQLWPTSARFHVSVTDGHILITPHPDPALA